MIPASLQGAADMSTNHDSLPRRSFLGTAALGTVAAVAFGGAAAAAAELTDKEKANIKVLEDWAASWKTGDATKVASFFSEKCVVRINAGTDRPGWTSRPEAAEQ